MPTISVRFTAVEAQILWDEAERRGLSVSAVIRDKLQFASSARDVRLDDLEQRVARVEGVAGL